MSDKDRAGYYVLFEGIAAKVGTHDFTQAPYSFSGVCHGDLDGASLTGGGRTLDRDAHMVTEGELGFRIIETDATLAMFRRRGGVEDTLLTAVSSSATTIRLASLTSLYAAGTKIFLGRETITLTTDTGGGVYTGCTRGVDGSVAVAHDDGEKMSDVPLFWWTRGVTLYHVDLDTVDEFAVWSGTLSDSPQSTNGALEFTAAGALNDLLKRSVCAGFREVRPSSVTLTASNALLFTFANAADEYEFAAGDVGGFVRVMVDGKTSFFYFDNLNLAGGQLQLLPTAGIVLPTNPAQVVWGMPSNTAQLTSGAEVTLKQVERVEGRIGHAALRVMLSTTGEGDNHATYDTLPGRSANASGASNSYFRRRMGAGIPAARVDVLAWQQALGGSDHEIHWLLEQTDLMTFLEGLLWRSGGYAYYAAGTDQLSWKQYSPATIRGALTALNAETGLELADVSAIDDETGVPTLGRVSANFNPFAQRYEAIREVQFFDDAQIYGDRNIEIEYSSTALRLGPDAASTADLIIALARARDRQNVAGRRTSYKCPWEQRQTITIGARFSLTDTRLNNHEGTRGVSGRPVEVVGITPDYAAGSFVAEFEEVPRGWLIAPAAVVASWSSPTLTLATTGPLGSLADDANPGADFVANSSNSLIRVYDASASPPFSASTVLTTTSASGTTIGTSGVPSFTPAAGDLVVIEDDLDTGDTNDVGADVEDFAYGAGSDYLMGPDNRAGARWT